MSALLNIPIELLNIVTSQLTPEDLFSLTQANKSLASWLTDLALPLQYHHTSPTPLDPPITARLPLPKPTTTPPITLAICPSPATYNNRTLLHHIVTHSTDPHTLTHFLVHHPSTHSLITATDTAGLTPLHLAAAISALICIPLLVAGAPINAVSTAGETPLFIAVEAGRADVVSCLIEYGADVSVVEERTGLTALQKAVMFGKEDVVRCFGGVELEGLGVSAGEGVYEPLGRATSAGFLETVRRMLEVGLDPFAGGVPAVKVISCWRNGLATEKGVVLEDCREKVGVKGGAVERKGAKRRRVVDGVKNDKLVGIRGKKRERRVEYNRNYNGRRG